MLKKHSLLGKIFLSAFVVSVISLGISGSVDAKKVKKRKFETFRKFEVCEEKFIEAFCKFEICKEKFIETFRKFKERKF